MSNIVKSNLSQENIFLETADRIAAKICRDAIWADDRCNWVGDSKEYVNFQTRLVHRALDPSIYAGTSGISLFLSRIFQVTHDRIFRLTAEGSILQALSKLDRINEKSYFSFYSGALGVLWAAIEVGEIINNQQIIDRAKIVLKQCFDLPINEHMLDLISGSASAIPTFLNLYRRLSDDSFLQLAVLHGERLLKCKVVAESGWSWSTMSSQEVTNNLCGFGHGAAGIGLACLELYSVTHDRRFYEAAKQAFKYEQHWIDKSKGNYPDFRVYPQFSANQNRPLNYMTAWCHGAPGIGLSRTRAYALCQEDDFYQEAAMTIQTTITEILHAVKNARYSFCLCHGIGGNSTLLLYASHVFRNSDYLKVAKDAGRVGAERFWNERLPWICGVPDGEETPNLMLGTSGIGFFYLNLYNLSILPPVLIPSQQDLIP